MKKKIIAIVLILTMLGAMGMTASAAESRASTIIPTLTFDGTTANCQASITGIGKTIDATLELWHGDTLVDSWDGTATSRLILSGSCTVTKGQTYTLKVSGTIGGVEFEGTPVSGTCK